MNPEPIDEQRISMLLDRSSAAEEARQRTAQCWRSYKAREKRQKRIFFLVMLPLLAGALIFAVVTLQRVFRITEPEKPAERVLSPSTAPREGVWRDGRLQSYTF